MAEIKIKKEKPIWPWILVGLAILAIILFFVFADNDDDDYTDDVDDVTTEQRVDDDYNNASDEKDTYDAKTASFSTALESYSNYIGETEKMEIDHEYSNGALIYLVNAIEAKANDLKIDVSANLNEARANANKITKDPYKVNHADLIKNSGMIIVNAIRKIQREKFPNLSDNVSRLEQNVASIEKNTETLNQKETVNMFYQSAEEVLSNMK